MTVTGVGFILNNTTVQLVPTGGGTTLNITTGLTFNTSNPSTGLTFTVPAGTKTTYYVEVTTPSGSSGSSGAPPVHPHLIAPASRWCAVGFVVSS